MSNRFGTLKRSLLLVDRPLRRRLVLLTVAALALAALDAVGVLLVIPLVQVVDNGAAADLPVVGSVGAGPLLGTVVGLFIAKAVIMAGLRWWILGVTLRANSRAAGSLYSRLVTAPLEFHDSRNSADSVRLITISVKNFFEQGVVGAANLVAESMSVLLLVGLLLARVPLAGLVSFAYLLVAMALYATFVQRHTANHARRADELTGTAVRMINEALGALPELRVRRTTTSVQAPFERTADELAMARRRIQFSGEFGRYYLEIVFFGAIGVVAATVLVAESADAALPVLALLSVVGFRVLLSLSRILAAANRIRVGRASLDLIAGELETIGWSTPTPSGDAAISSIGPATITAEALGFCYQRDGQPVLDDIDLRVAAGTSLGIVGGSGSGKSTLLELICGLRSPTTGRLELTVGGREGAVPVIGYVPQSVFSLDSTIIDNITLGHDVDEASVWSALETAALDDFVRALPEGLQTKVGESGTNVSGGQRQRIGLARALLLQPGLLVLDEATSALDRETEEAVLTNIAHMHPETTVIVVTHRPAALAGCDQVVRLLGGRLEPAAVYSEDVSRRVPT